MSAGNCYLSNGDGAAATLARIASPVGVATDGLGGLWISDWAGFRVRYVDTTGIISTVAGLSIAPAATAATYGNGGQATTARFNTPCEFVAASAPQQSGCTALNRGRTHV